MERPNMKTKPTIALCAIARDKSSTVYKFLNSTKGVFDLYCLQDTGSTDNEVELWEKWCKENNKAFKTQIGKMVDNPDYSKPGEYAYVLVNNKKILGDFGEARQDSFDMAKGCDYAFWFDLDDVLVNAEVIPQAVEMMKQNGFQLGMMEYDYAKTNTKLKAVTQKRERLIDIGVQGHWEDMVHETYIIPGIVKYMEIRECLVEHERTAEDVVEMGRRNLLIMEKQLARDGLEKFSNKMLHNLAFDHWEHKEYSDAIKYYKLFIKRFPANEPMLFDVYMKVARAYLESSKFIKAIEYAFKANNVNPKMAEPYLILSEVYNHTGNFMDCIYYADKVLSIGKPETTSPINEYEYSVVPLRLKAHSFLQLGDLQKAKEMMIESYRVSGDGNIINEIRSVENNIVINATIRSIITLVQYYQNNNLVSELDRLIQAIPLSLMDNREIMTVIREVQSDYKRKSEHIVFKDRKSIAIYAGDQVIEAWDGESDITRGIGGSEGMCIQLSRELAKLNNKVVVFNSCGDSSGKVLRGVEYRNAKLWNPDLKSDVFISLRRPDVFMQTIKAKKQYLWLHDTGYGEHPPICFTSPNKVIVLSQAHKDIIKQSHNISDDSIFWVSRNGFNPIALEYAEKNAGKRNPYQLVYASSYDRGLDFLLENWSKVKEAIPQATLKIMYGWNTYDSLMNARLQRQESRQEGEYMLNNKNKLVDLIAKSEGVQEIGRVSQNENYKLFAESGVWFYPTGFYEISCASGDTKILMPRDHRKYPLGVPIKELAGKSNFYVYSYDHETNKIVLGKVKWVAKTRENAELMKITLDDGTIMKFTSDHKFMTRDGDYKAVKDLKVGESLMPCYERPQFLIKQPNGFWDAEHRMLCEAHYGDIKGKVVDHKNGDRYDNTIDNLQLLNSSEHARKTFGQDRYIGKIARENMSKGQKAVFQTEKRKESAKIAGGKRSKKFWDVFKTWSKEKQKEWSMNRASKVDKTKLSTSHKKNWANQYVKGNSNEQPPRPKQESEQFYNHKIKSIEKLEQKEDVYDMEIEKYHNFAAEGVFVHNCITGMYAQALGCVPVCTPFAALNETVGKYGIKLNRDHIVDGLIYYLKHLEDLEARRKPMIEWAKDKYAMDKLAISWDKFFNND